MNESVRVPAALAGERVDSAVALLTGWSRADVQTLLGQHAVLVDGATVSKSRRLREGEVIELLEEPAPAQPPQPEPDVDVTVRYEDDDVVVVAKPAGLVVHPGAGNDTGTLVHGLLARYPEMAGVGGAFRPGIVHRLDRETSGLLVVARSERAYDNLVEQLAAHTVERRYGALVWGHLATARGMIDAPIGRSEARRTRMAVRDAGRPARTGYEVHETFETPLCSRLECRLETGRTHQIRVHLTAIGHPVVGDGTYGGLRDSIALARPFLHAAVLGFIHPVTGDALRFKEPLPDELEAVLAALREEAR